MRRRVYIYGGFAVVIALAIAAIVADRAAVFDSEGTKTVQERLEESLIEREGRLFVESHNVDGTTTITEYKRDESGRLVRDGKETTRRSDGTVWDETMWSNGREIGPHHVWDLDGRMRSSSDLPRN